MFEDAVKNLFNATNATDKALEELKEIKDKVTATREEIESEVVKEGEVVYECDLYDADTYQETGELMLIGTMDIQGEPKLGRIVKDETGIEMQIAGDITPLDVVKAEEDEDVQYRTANLVVMYMESV